MRIKVTKYAKATSGSRNVNTYVAAVAERNALALALEAAKHRVAVAEGKLNGRMVREAQTILQSGAVLA